MSIIDSFVGLYPVQKTLRFELRPQEYTKKFLDTAEDFVRAERYPQLKKVIDDYYRYYIDCVLSAGHYSPVFDTEKMYQLYVEIKKKKNKEKKKEYEDLTVKIRKNISIHLKNYLKDFGLEKYEQLLKEKSLFRNWIDERLENGTIDIVEYNLAEDAIRSYNGFVTCLTDFKNNRENMFAADGATSIASRVVENMERFFNNCYNNEVLHKKYSDITEMFEGKEYVFDHSKYFEIITQTAIDKYNEIMGNRADDIYEKGINQRLNEYAQKKGLKNRDVPKMNALYKQILSDKKPFLQEKIDSDKDLFKLLNDSYTGFRAEIENAVDIVKTGMDGDETIFIVTASLPDISRKIFAEEESSWGVLDRAVKLFSEKMRKKKDEYKNVISIADLQAAVDSYCQETSMSARSIKEYFRSFSMEKINDSISEYEGIQDLDELNENRNAPTDSSPAGKGYEQCQVIKNMLDALIDALHFFKPFYLYKDGKKLSVDEEGENFYNGFIYEYNQISEIVPLYNKVRNYLTAVTKIDKKKVRNFLGSSSLLSGWEREPENNGCYFFYSEGKYYLADFLDVRGIDFDRLNKDDGESWRVYYYLQKLDSKNFPRIFIGSEKFQDKANEYEGFAEVKKIYEKKLYVKSAPIPQEVYKRNIRKMIDYYKYALSVHESFKDLVFSFKPSDEYKDINEFFIDAMKSGYYIKKLPTDFSYLKELEKENKILLFMVYSKDFSEHSHGKPNMHTLYFKELFSDENIIRMQEGKPFLQLNGKAQMYTRLASIEPKITHEKNKPIRNKNPLNEKKESIFGYDLIKDRRFSETKMFLHFPITLNCGTQDTYGMAFNTKVNQFLFDNSSVNVIGIDRGERNLLYYSVIDRSGKILEQNTLNCIDGVDYHRLLDERETAREVARKTWGKIDSIAKLKEGYLSKVTQVLTELMIKYNAILVLENLNKEMKRSRIKVEKQVYQKFEHAIIDKLNYLVFKDKCADETGGVLKGYQLTSKLNKYDDIGEQNGFLFYIDPWCTSKICPKTGFVNLLNTDYVNVKKAQEFFAKFDDILYNEKEDYFEFSFDYDSFGRYDIVSRKQWNVCTYGDRLAYSAKEKRSFRVVLTDEFKKLFERYGIAYRENRLQEQIIDRTEKDFFTTLLVLLRLTLQIRNSTVGTGDENDYILSCVKDGTGTFFDSRRAAEYEPNNADANGAYHIALKGLWTLDSIKEDGTYDDCTKKEWLKARQ